LMLALAILNICWLFTLSLWSCSYITWGYTNCG